MSSPKKIEAAVGQPVQITLQSMAGSTGYSWHLTKLEGGLALSRAYSIPTAPGITPVNQTFDFLATAEGSFKVVFNLIAPWRAGESADCETFEVEIKAPSKTPAEDIASALKGRDFVSASTVNVGATSPTVAKYAAPMAQASDPCAVTMLYAAPMSQAAPWPPQVIYAAPMAQAAFNQAPQVIYAAPMSQPAPWPQVIYAAPMAQASNQAPQVIYAAPMSQPAPWPQVIYAAPMAQAAFNQAPQVIYAAPMSQPWPPITVLYAAPITAQPPVWPLYAAPIIQPYAAPFTSVRCS